MSLLNAWIAPNEAIVAVDTVCAGGTVSSKLSLIPHLPAVLAMRGQRVFHTLLFVKCLDAGFRTFDEMTDRMPELLRAVEPWMSEEMMFPGSGAKEEVFITGWSHRRNWMVGWSFVKKGIDTEFDAEEVVRSIAPSHESMSGLSLKSGAVEKLAAAQVKLMRSLRPDAHFGGTLIVCRVTKTSITTTHRMQFQEMEKAA